MILFASAIAGRIGKELSVCNLPPIAVILLRVYMIRMVSQSFITALTWASLLTVPPIGGYWLGRVQNASVRMALLAAFLLTPVLILTILMATTPPAPPNSFAWWEAGLIMILPAIVIWGMLAGTGYAVSRGNVR
jgi:hypothetical protein